LKLLFDILDVLKRLLEVVVTALAFVISLFNKLKRAQSQAAILVCFTKQANGLAFGTETTNGLLIRDIEGGFRIWGLDISQRCRCLLRNLSSSIV
jgi:hypothetical protein